MSITDEEYRAALWRQQRAERAQFQLELWLSLQAPPEPRQEVLDDWMPLILWAAERNIVIPPEQDL